MKSLQATLFAEPYRFEFFQAVRLLQRAFPENALVGSPWSTRQELMRFRSWPALAFPTSDIHELLEPKADNPFALMTVTFLGLYGPSGVLPTHYTQLLLDLQRDVRGEERQALRAWLDLFNHRLISLFYRAWEKYRFELPFERGEAFRREPDAFTRALLSLIGLGQPSLRDRFAVRQRPETDAEEAETPLLARIEDLALLHYGGILAHRPRNQVGLQAMLQDYFEVPIRVLQFQGQWLPIDRAGQTQLGASGVLGVDAVAGERVWEVQSKFRIRLGPIDWSRFQQWLPDPSPIAERKSMFLLMQLVRFYAGPEWDFDIQVVLARHSVPPSRLDSSSPIGLRLGWNTWIVQEIPAADLDDAQFPGQYVTQVPC
jgi:type VI secretion system protein ImpH